MKTYIVPVSLATVAFGVILATSGCTDQQAATANALQSEAAVLCGSLQRLTTQLSPASKADVTKACATEAVIAATALDPAMVAKLRAIVATATVAKP